MGIWRIGDVEQSRRSGGSAYMAQRFYAAPNEASCRKIAMLWTVLFAFRWPMVVGFAILAIHLGIGRDDPETILPLVLQSEFFPNGIRGVVVAAIFAASMSTFDSTINAGASYVVKDLVQPLRPAMSSRQLVWVGYAASAGIVAVGLLLALTAVTSVLEVWVAIVIQLFPAFLVPFALRWYWGRFNGAGFSAGIVMGFGASFGLFLFAGGLDLNELEILSLVAGTSLAGCLLGTFLTQPVSGEVLELFYRRIRPFGFWPKSWSEEDRDEHRGDLLRLVLAVIWQLITFLLPMLAVLHEWGWVVALGLVWAGLSVFLWRQADVVKKM